MSTSTMSDEHKAALAQGRQEGRAVRLYLEAVTVPKRRGRRRTPAGVMAELERTTEQLKTAKPLDRLLLTQKRIDLEAELATLGADPVDITALEAAFIEVAAGYAERKGLSREAFRSIGVPAAVLRAAGIR